MLATTTIPMAGHFGRLQHLPEQQQADDRDERRVQAHEDAEDAGLTCSGARSSGGCTG